MQGWATPSNAEHFGGFNYVPSRTATRPVPATSSASASTSQQASSGPNVGAIAGGTVGGVIALVAIIAVMFLCLRIRRRQQGKHSQPEELDSNPTAELGSTAMTQKPAVDYAVSEGGTLCPSSTTTPAYSPQASPPPPSMSWHGEQVYQQSPPLQAGEWTHSSVHSYSQTYYPPPPDPSQPPKQLSPLQLSAELPGIQSPISAELSEVRSPTNAELPELGSPIPVRGP